jgi:hypothetical protein
MTQHKTHDSESSAKVHNKAVTSHEYTNISSIFSLTLLTVQQIQFRGMVPNNVQ